MNRRGESIRDRERMGNGDRERRGECRRERERDKERDV